MKVLITGGAGFIGSHIVDLLIRNKHDVVIVDNMSHGKFENINSNAMLYKVDIRNEEVYKVFQKEKPDVVIHNAAQINVSNSIENPVEDASINILGTINVLEASRKCEVKKIIYPDSAAIFGEPEYLPIDENHPLNMISNYGVSKHTVEHYLEVYKKLYNIDYIVLRYSNVYGPRQDSSGEGGVVAIFCEKLINGKPIYIYGDGKQVRDFVYVKDVAMANLACLDVNKSGMYNVCSNTKTSINELLFKIRNIVDKNVIPVYIEARKGDIKRSYMSYDKINNDLGWKPKYSLDKGLMESIRYYVESLNL